jgi:hypothetical protein
MQDKKKRRTVGRRKPDDVIEVCRSFAFKLNVGNYESRDFFCSAKLGVESPRAEAVSAILATFCRSEVMKTVDDYKRAEEKEKEAKLPLKKQEAYQDARDAAEFDAASGQIE